MTGRRRIALRAVRDGSIVAGLLFTAYLFLVVAPKQATVGFDAFAYWSVDPSDPYVVPPGGLSAFNYSPPIARLFGFFGRFRRADRLERLDRAAWKHCGGLPAGQGRLIEILVVVCRPRKVLRQRHGNLPCG